MGGPPMRQPGFLQFDCSLSEDWLEAPLPASLACPLNRNWRRSFKTGNALENQDSYAVWM